MALTKQESVFGAAVGPRSPCEPGTDFNIHFLEKKTHQKISHSNATCKLIVSYLKGKLKEFSQGFQFCPPLGQRLVKD